MKPSKLTALASPVVGILAAVGMGLVLVTAGSSNRWLTLSASAVWGLGIGMTIEMWQRFPTSGGLLGSFEKRLAALFVLNAIGMLGIPPLQQLDSGTNLALRMFALGAVYTGFLLGQWMLLSHGLGNSDDTDSDP